MTSPAPYWPAGITPLERRVVVRMILGHHREALVLAVERRAFRHGPREQHAVAFEAEVVVEPSRRMHQHDEQERARARIGDRARRLGRDIECPLRRIFAELA